MNPYTILNIDRKATAQEIVQASALALRERKYSAREVAEARQQLMNPDARLILDFVHSVDLDLLIKSDTGSYGERTDDTRGIGTLQRLTLFDDKA